MTLFRDRFRVESARHPAWDYSSPGAYFITICTYRRACFFGSIRQGRLEFSLAGAIAQQTWAEIPKHFRNIQTDAFVVMPNHVHGILLIGDRNDIDDESSRAEAPKLGDFVGSYKAAVSRRCRQSISTFAWQPRFHDRIIRSEKMLGAIREYIAENPRNWSEDEFFV